MLCDSVVQQFTVVSKEATWLALKGFKIYVMYALPIRIVDL